MSHKDDLDAFVDYDRRLQQAEADVAYLKCERGKLQDRILDYFGMNSQNKALIEYPDGTYKVYTRRYATVRVVDQQRATTTLRTHGLEDFIDEKVATGHLAMYYKKREKAGEEIPSLAGLEFVDSYRLYVLKKKDI